MFRAVRTGKVKSPTAGRAKRASRALKATQARDGFAFKDDDFYKSEQWQALRKQALHRDGYRCRECSSKDELTVHHRLPRTSGGLDILANLITLCQRCHGGHHGHMRKR